MTNQTAINKFMFYTQNYGCISFDYTDIHGNKRNAFVPEFFRDIKFGEFANVGHFVSKWEHFAETGERLIGFYFALSNNNKAKLIDWVLENYKGNEL